MPVSPLPQFRLKQDVPTSVAVEPGFAYDQHCHDMHPGPAAFNGTWQEPNTGLIMLRPSFLTDSFYGSSNWKTLSDWTHDASYWQTVFHDTDLGSGVARFFSTTLPAGSSMIPILTAIAIAAISITSSLLSDVIHWVLQSTFTLAGDQGFVLYHHALAFEHHQYQNWMEINFGDLLLHFSYDGTVRVYQYGADMTVAPTQIEEFEMASPGDLNNRNGYIIVIPVPGFGLSIYHSHAPQRIPRHASSGLDAAKRGHLVPIKRQDGSGNYYVHNGGVVNIGIGALVSLAQQKFGFAPITYATGDSIATFKADTIDPGFVPTTLPSGTAVLIQAAHGTGTVATAFRKPDDSGAWTTGDLTTPGNRLGRVKATVSNSTAANTPFMISMYTAWTPVFATRATTARQPDRLLALEFTDDDLGQCEGYATVLEQSDAGRKLIERGDTTWQIEKSLDGGTTWTVHQGGFAQLADAVDVRMDGEGIYYIARWQLRSRDARLAEANHVRYTAFDNLTIGDAINKAHTACSEPLVAPLAAELTAASATLPAALDGNNFRWAPKFGEDVSDVIKHFLLMVRKQYVEWRHWYDWKNAKWVVDKKPRDTSAGATWTLTAFPDEVDLANVATNRTVGIAAGAENELFKFSVSPPEANQIQAFGCSQPNWLGINYTAPPMRRVKSVTDPTSVEYLGRVKTTYLFFAPLTGADAARINQMERIVFDAASCRRLQPVIVGKNYIDALTPGLQVKIRGLDATGARAELLVYTDEYGVTRRPWLKRRTVNLDYTQAGDIAPTVTYTLDTVWESDLG